MSKKAHPALIGIFVLGAIVLLLVVLLFVAGGRIFRETRQGVAYFDGSVRGLQVGSNVVFQGVPIGSVTDIRVVVDTEALELSIPVVMELDQSMLDFTGDPGSPAESYSRIRSLVAQGLRAQLVIDSLVTGQVLVQFGFHPETPEVYRGPPDLELIEIPTIPSDLQVVMERVDDLVGRVEEIPVEELLGSLASSAAALDGLLNSEELPRIVGGVDRLVNAEETQQLTASLQETLEKLRTTLDEAGGLLRHADAEIDPLTERVGATLEELDVTLEGARGLLADLRRTTSEDSELYLNANQTLRELEGAMRSLRLFLDLLERHPEALLRGRRSR